MNADDRQAKLPIVRIGNSLRFSEEIVSDYSLESKLYAKHPDIAKRYFELNEYHTKDYLAMLETIGCSFYEFRKDYRAKTRMLKVVFE